MNNWKKLLTIISCLLFCCHLAVSAKEAKQDHLLQAEDGWTVFLPEEVNLLERDLLLKAVDKEKLATAKEMTDWLQSTLKEKKALVAVIARPSQYVKKYDPTGMGHSGIALYNPKVKTWVIYHLLHMTRESTRNNPQAKIWISAPLNFFYDQNAKEKNALLMIPSEAMQKRIYAAFSEKEHKNLFFTTNFSLLSPYNGANSLNCNKWVLLNLFAAKYDNYQPLALLETIDKEFKLKPLKFSSKDKARISHVKGYRKENKLSPVTVESLYESNLFEEKIFYQNK